MGDRIAVQMMDAGKNNRVEARSFDGMSELELVDFIFVATTKVVKYLILITAIIGACEMLADGLQPLP